MPAGLIAARFIHYLSLQFLFGALVFPLYAYPWPARRQTPRLGVWAPIAAVLGLLSGLAWFVFAVAGMADVPVTAIDVGVFRSAIADTTFGHLWIARLILNLALVLLLSWRKRVVGGLIAPTLTALLLGFLAGTRHAQADQGGREAIHVVADVVHLLTSGLWLGALPCLVQVLRLGPHRGQPHAAARVVSRFSAVAIGAVALLLASGVVNTLLLIRSPDELVVTGWGRSLSIKLAMVCLMIALAGVNRRRLSPALDGPGAKTAAIQLMRHAMVEIVLGAGVLATVSVLGVLAP